MSQEQAAKCVLKLNTPVLNALFPEGTEARVQLVNAALTEVTNTYVKSALSGHVQTYLHTLTQEVKAATNIKTIVDAYFNNSGAWNSVISIHPGTKLADAIARTVESALGEKFIALVELEVNKRVADYEARLESRVEYMVKKRIDQLTVDAIQKRVDAAVNAARLTL